MRGELGTDRGVDQRMMIDRVLLLLNISLLETNQKEIIETSTRGISRNLNCDCEYDDCPTTCASCSTLTKI
jgi:hypothetical protein